MKASSATAANRILPHSLLGLSLANLCLLRGFAEAPPYLSGNSMALLRQPPSTAYYAALLLNLAIIGAILGQSFRGAESGSRVARFASRATLLIAGLIALNSMRRVLAYHFPVLTLTGFTPNLPAGGRYAALGTMFALTCAILYRGRSFLMPFFVGAVTILSPLVPLSVGATVWMIAQPPAGYAESSSASGASTRDPKGTRVVIVLFDEFDYHLAFEAQRHGLRLPNLDRLREKAFFALDARSPSDQTMVAVPSILTGRKFVEVKATGPRKIAMRTRGSQDWTDWADEANIFRDAKTKGLRPAIAGWYLPYCRIFSADLAACSWWQASFVAFPSTNEWHRNMRNQLAAAIEAPRVSPLPISLQREADEEILGELMPAAIRQTGDPSLDLVFLHLPMSHAPYFYNRATSSFGPESPRSEGYWNGLALTDKCLGMILDAASAKAVKDRTVLMLTSDHSYREPINVGAKRDYRVPFIVRFPRDSRGVDYPASLETTTLRRVVAAILGDEVQTSSKLQGFLTARSTNK